MVIPVFSLYVYVVVYHLSTSLYIINLPKYLLGFWLRVEIELQLRVWLNSKKQRIIN